MNWIGAVGSIWAGASTMTSRVTTFSTSTTFWTSTGTCFSTTFSTTRSTGNFLLDDPLDRNFLLDDLLDLDDLGLPTGRENRCRRSQGTDPLGRG